MSRGIQHVLDAVRQENSKRIEPVFDRDHPIRSTGEMRSWYTGKPCHVTHKSHINVCVYDNTGEASDAFALEHSEAVAAWAKNDHLGFEILYLYQYLYQGVLHKYHPNFLVRLSNDEMFSLETKGDVVADLRCVRSAGVARLRMPDGSTV